MSQPQWVTRKDGVTLPDTATGARDEQQPMTQTEAANLRLLIADDSLNDAEVIVSMLRNAGYAVRPEHVNDPDALRESLTSRAFDLFLCGVELEGIGLDDALQVIRKSGLDVPVIALSETVDQATRCEVMGLGAVDLATKEDLEHLRLVVRREFDATFNKRQIRRLERQVRETENRCSALLHRSRDPIAYVHDGMHVYANPAYLDFFGYESADDIEGMPILDLVAPENQAEFRQVLREVGRGGRAAADMELNIVRQGKAERLRMDISAAAIDGEPCIQLLMPAVNQTSGEAEKLEQEINKLNRTDLATGLMNRIHFSSRLEDAVLTGETATRDDRTDGLLHIQLDDAAKARERFGATGHDRIMGQLAALLRADLEEDCLAGRISETALIAYLPGRSVHDTIAMAEAICLRVDEAIFEIGGETFTTTASCGAVMLGPGPAQVHQAVADVEAACETAHYAGGNRIHLHSAMAGEADEDNALIWEERLKAALENNRFQLVYMPIASLSSDRQPRYEIRLRLQDEEGVIRGADYFMQAAIRCGLGPALDRWAVEHAIESLAARKDDTSSVLFLKLSGVTLADRELPDFLAQQLTKHCVAAAQLNFELNESEAVTRLTDAKPMFEKIRELGCGLTLDHFGTGLNPFQLLKHLPAGWIKLDRAITRDLAKNPEGMEKLRKIITLARNKDLNVIASYIEDAQTLAFIWQANIVYVQGHFLQPPSTTMQYDFSGTVI